MTIIHAGVRTVNHEDAIPHQALKMHQWYIQSQQEYNRKGISLMQQSHDTACILSVFLQQKNKRIELSICFFLFFFNLYIITPLFFLYVSLMRYFCVSLYRYRYISLRRYNISILCIIILMYKRFSLCIIKVIPFCDYAVIVCITIVISSCLVCVS